MEGLGVNISVAATTPTLVMMNTPSPPIFPGYGIYGHILQGKQSTYINPLCYIILPISPLIPCYHLINQLISLPFLRYNLYITPLPIPQLIGKFGLLIISHWLYFPYCWKCPILIRKGERQK